MQANYLFQRALRYVVNLTAQLQQASNVGYRQRLRSSSSAKLDVPRTEHVTIGGRAFSSTAACVWNSLPTAVQSLSYWTFSMPPENWTVRAFLQLTQRLSNDFTAAWLTITFPQLFAVAATLKSIGYNVAMTFILNNNNNEGHSVCTNCTPTVCKDFFRWTFGVPTTQPKVCRPVKISWLKGHSGGD